jgi:tRNA (guanine-N7-)-methyltransferase
MSEAEHPRAIRSFVVRSGRITEAQQQALDSLWPRYGVEFSPQQLDLDALFGRAAPRVVEIGFGNGDNLLALAQAHPEQDYLGIEVHRAGIGRLMLGAGNSQLKNLRVISHDAVDVLAQQLPARSIAQMLILFPDPRPKKRHHKRRLIQQAFAALAASRLAPGGLLRLATDWEPYAHHMLEVLNACPALENTEPSGGFCPRAPDRIATRFEKRGSRLGHSVWDLAFRAF